MRVLLRPRWFVGTLIAILLIVLFVNLGFWQLRRLDEKRGRNAAIRERGARQVEPVDDLVDPRTGFDDVGGLVYRRASARGRYDRAGEVKIRSRSLDGEPGEWVVTPLLLG